jgi:hypothetical protein
VAAVLLVIAGLSAVAGIDRLATGHPPTAAIRVLQSVSGLSWSDTAAVAASSVAVVLGIVLLVCGIVPGKRKAAALPVSGDAEPAPATAEAAIPHKALAHLVAVQAKTLNGIDRIHVKANAHTVRVQASTPTRYVHQVSDDLRHNVAETLTSMGIRRPPKVRVQVDQVSR